MKNVSQTLEFMRRHWWHVLLLIPGAVAITAIHETAHAVSVILQGGTITEFAVLPAKGNWGHVRFIFPSEAPQSKFLLATAPYLLWLLSAVIVSLISKKDAKPHFWLKSTLYVWGFVIPLGDIANAYVPWLLRGSKNDFYAAFGSPGLAAALLFPLGLGLVYLWGFRVQKHLYATDRLAIVPYSLLYSGALGCVLLLNI